MLKFNIIIARLVIIITVLLAACQQTPPPFQCTDEIGCVTIKPGEPIKIGALHDLSGQIPVLGNEQVRAIELALTQQNNQLLGHPVELHVEDEKCTPQGGANAALKLVADPQIIGIIGTTCSSSATTASKIMSEAGLVMISGTNSAASLTSLGGVPGENWQRGYFRTSTNGAQPGVGVAEFVFKELGLTKVATINDGNLLNKGLATVFQQSFTELGGEIVLEATIDQGDPNMQPVVTAVADTKAEILFLATYSEEAILIVPHIKRITNKSTGENIKLIGLALLVTDDFIKTVGVDGTGMYFTVQAPIANNLDDAYKARYNESPTTAFYHYTYDAAHLLLNAIKAVAIQKDDGTVHIGRQALRNALYATTSFEGVTGLLICNQFGDCNGTRNNIVRLDDPSAGVAGVKSNVLYSYPPEK